MPPQTTTITPEQQIADLAATVLRLTGPPPFAGTKRQIVDAARLLAEEVTLYVAGKLPAVTIDERIPF